MATSKLKRALWVMNQLVQASNGNGITIAELSDKWYNSCMNDEKDEGIPHRTFYRIRRNLESLFDINIECSQGAQPRYRVSSEDLEPGNNSLLNLIFNKVAPVNPDKQKSSPIGEILNLVLSGKDVPEGTLPVRVRLGRKKHTYLHPVS